MAETVLEFKNLTLGFKVGSQIIPVLNSLTFDVRAGEVLGIVGESGSGKSTALFAAVNYLSENARISQGEILLHGQNTLALSRTELDKVRGRRIAMVFQDPTSALNPSMSVGAQIAEGVAHHTGLSGDALHELALDWLQRVHLDGGEATFAKFPHELSGGQRQRVMIALAMAMDPDVLLMDEPTTALDVMVQARILELVKELSRSANIAVILVTHDLAAAAVAADRILVLYAGEIMEIGRSEAVIQHPTNPYTMGLIAALPQLKIRANPRAIPGSISRSPDRFSACVFAERCEDVQDICKTTRPALIGTEGASLSRCHFTDHKSLTVQSEKSAEKVVLSSLSTEAPPILECKDLNVVYKRPFSLSAMFSRQERKGFHAVHDMSFDLYSGQTLAIVGESGSGKTTIAHTALGLIQPASGQFRFNGKDLASLSAAELRAYRQQVQIVFQHPASSLNPRKTILDLVSRPLRLAGMEIDAAHKTASNMLNEVGLDASYHTRFPSELSGGEMQRVAIARAFVTKPKVLILDEPTTSLDVSVQASVLQLLARLQSERNCAFLLISHDLSVVRQLADDIIVMRNGKICESGPIDQIYNAPQHSYTRDLLSAAPSI